MKKYLLILIVCIACKTSDKVIIEGVSYSLPSPPNGIKISDNLFADETEVSNIGYREYLFWLKIHFGIQSDTYINALPDTTVWLQSSAELSKYVDGYLRNPSYDTYPIVGINYAQAQNYTKWRTDRVAEAYLMKKGLVGRSSIEKPFSIERYLEGGYPWIIKQESIKVPVFKMPNSEEWEKMAAIGSEFKFGTDPEIRHNKKVLKYCNNLFNVSGQENNNPNQIIYPLGELPFSSNELSKNINGLLNIVGNVAEIGEGNVVRGGAWNSDLKDDILEVSTPFQEPKAWVGFRNVSKYEVFEIE